MLLLEKDSPEFKSLVERVQKRQPKLMEEVDLKLNSPIKSIVQPDLEGVPKTEVTTIDRDTPVLNIHNRALESIIRANLRPVMTIRDNRVVSEFAGPDVDYWKEILIQNERVLNSAIPSVGRIEVNNNMVYKWVGTGWLIDSDVIITNRHVASEFAKNREGFSFRLGYPSGYQTSRVDFLEEDQRTTSLEFDVDTVLWIAENRSSQPDVAFLRVRQKPNGPTLPLPIELADSVEEGELVVTIGYPARDSSIPEQDLVLKVFGDIYDKKRLAPGEITSVSQYEIEHDCSTLGGNSGSVVLSLLTGKAVGLHYAGLYMRGNYAVSCTVIRELLHKLKTNTLPRMAEKDKVNSESSPVTFSLPTNQLISHMQNVNTNKFVFEASIPIKITLEIGGAGSYRSDLNNQSNSHSTSLGDIGNQDFEEVLKIARNQFRDLPGVINIRKGFRFKRGWITDEKVIVIEVHEKQSFPELKQSGRNLLPQELMGVGIDVRTASLSDQLEYLGVDLPILEAVPRPGIYVEPPNVALTRITDERVKAIFHVSPDNGWPNLKAFLTRIERKLTATIYEWESSHISDAIEKAIKPSGRQLKMVTQKQGTEEAVQDMSQRLGSKFEHQWASVGSGKIVPSAYHIKVASRDGEEFWLSSGNWKDSNQADINPVEDQSTAITPLRKYNREWHAIIHNPTLAKMFEEFIEWDFKEAQRVPLEEVPPIPDIYLLIPEKAFVPEPEARNLGKYFAPKEIDRVIDIEPFLTPDRDDRGRRLFIKAATELIESAKHSIDIENQSFNLLDENDEQFEQFFSALLSKQNEGISIRIIFRDPLEFSRGAKGQAALATILERIKEFGLDTSNFKVQKRCHTKAIIIDSAHESGAAVLFGSHNLTTSGALYNRDASLLVRDIEVAKYFQEIFDYDWEVLASQAVEESVGGIKIVKSNEIVPLGFRKVSLKEIISDN